MNEIKRWEGYWHLPNKPEDKVGGVLTYDPNRGSILNCFSDFVCDSGTIQEIDPPVLFGETQEGMVTAFGSFRKTFLTDTGYFGEVDHLIPWQIDHQISWRPEAKNAVEALSKLVNKKYNYR